MSDIFSDESQKNARLSGKYLKLAEEVEKVKCVFCDLRDKYVIHSDDFCTLTVNIFPYIDGQLLVIPKRHIERLSDIKQGEMISIYKLTKVGIDLLTSTLDIKNYWWVIRDGDVSGKTVKHFHSNLMPYIESLNTWHYQKITINPVDLAQKLRTNYERTSKT